MKKYVLLLLLGLVVGACGTNTSKNVTCTASEADVTTFTARLENVGWYKSLNGDLYSQLSLLIAIQNNSNKNLLFLSKY